MAEKRRIAESKNTGVFQDLLRQVKLVYKLMGDKRISFFLKLLPIASIVYLVSPVDLAPGLALPVIGALDDAAVLWLGTTLFLTLCPEEIVQEHKEAMDKVVNATWLEMQQMDEARMNARGISTFFDWVKERSHLFRGVTFGTMRRDDAYSFTRLGTHIERADSTARILDVKYHVLLPSVKDVGGAVDYYQWSAVLRSVSAFEAYRKVYRDVITPIRLAELLVLREDLPRSLHFCMRQVSDTLDIVRNDRSPECLRLAGRIRSQLRYGRIQDIFAQGLHEYLTAYLDSMQELSVEVQKSFFAPTLPE